MTDKKKKPEAKGQQRLEEIEQESQKFDEAINDTREQLKDLKASYEDLNQDLSSKVDDLWDELPTSTSKGILDKLFKVSSPKRGQLQENINKLEVSLTLLGNKKSKLLLEKKEVEKALRDDGLNKLTSKLCIGLQDTIGAYLDFEKSFLDFKLQAAEIGQFDELYYNRVDNKRYPSFYNQVFGLILMKPGGLPGLTPAHFIETIGNIGEGDENPLKTDQRFARKETDQPILHDIGPVGLNDRQLEDKIGEIFERPKN